MTLTLRPYQSEAVDSIFSCWDNGDTSVLVSSPTGSGKSIIIAETIKRLVEGWPGIKIIVVTDSRELITQNQNALKNHAPHIVSGIYSAGLNKRQTRPDVIFCGIQSVYKRAYDFGKVDIVLTDECHMISRKSESRYFRFFKDLAVGNPSVCHVGFSATIWRTDTGLLHEGEGAMFKKIAYACDMKQLIKDGWLVPLISKSGSSKIDLSKVHIKNQEYDQRELAFAADNEILVKLAVEEIVENGKDRHSWLVFASSILHAQHIKEEFKKHGVICEIVTGETPKEERDRIVEGFRSGKTKCLVNVSVFVKGFDVPRVDLLALMTATRSTGRFVQACGRGMRPFTDSKTGFKKESCVLLDFGTNVQRLGMIDDIDPVQTKTVFNTVKSPPPVKECPKCHALIHARVMKCPACEYDFGIDGEGNGFNHGATAYSGPVMTDQIRPFLVDVKDIWVSKHAKPGKTPSVKISFFDSMEREYPVWACVSHSGYAGEKGRALIKQLGGTKFTVDEILKDYKNWKKVERIEVRMENKWPRITGFVFAKGRTTQETLV